MEAFKICLLFCVKISTFLSHWNCCYVVVNEWRSEQRLLLYSEFEEPRILHIKEFGAKILYRCSPMSPLYASETVFGLHLPSFRYCVSSGRGQKQNTAETAEQFSEFGDL